MKSKIKSNKISQKHEEDYLENHPFSPKILEDKNNKNNKIPVYEKLYK